MNQRKRKRYILALSYLAVATAVLLTLSSVYGARAEKYAYERQISRERALSELCECVDTATVNLRKSCCSSDKKILRGIGEDIRGQTASAKVCLGQLPAQQTVAEDIYKFLSQAGSYIVFLSESEKDLTQKQRQSLRQLTQYGEALSEALGKIRREYLEGSLDGGDIAGVPTYDEESLADFGEGITDLTQSLEDYPTLIYDGPFADIRLDYSYGESLQDMGEVTRQEACETAAEYLGVSASGLRQQEDIKGKLQLYCFSYGDKAAAVTKKGGRIYYILDDSPVGEETIGAEEAIRRGKAFLKKAGYDSMKDSYYSIYDGVCTVNYAYCSEGIIHYSDLIKVSVALDSGRVLSLDASAYLLNHRKRDIYRGSVSIDEARGRLSSDLQVIGETSAVIPLDTGKEAFCYEFLCRDSTGGKVLVYIDRTTAEEREILLLVESEGGFLIRK